MWRTSILPNPSDLSHNFPGTRIFISNWAAMPRALLNSCSPHPLETLLVRLVDLRHFVAVLL